MCVIFALDLFRGSAALEFMVVVALLSNELFVNSQPAMFVMPVLGFGGILTMLLGIKKCFRVANRQH